MGLDIGAPVKASSNCLRQGYKTRGRFMLVFVPQCNVLTMNKVRHQRYVSFRHLSSIPTSSHRNCCALSRLRDQSQHTCGTSGMVGAEARSVHQSGDPTLSTTFTSIQCSATKAVSVLGQRCLGEHAEQIASSTSGLHRFLRVPQRKSASSRNDRTRDYLFLCTLRQAQRGLQSVFAGYFDVDA